MWEGNFDKLFIGGHWTKPASHERIIVTSPYTERTVAEVVSASQTDADLAVRAARWTFDAGHWRSAPLEERVSVMRRLSDLLEQNEAVMGDLITREMGCPIRLSVKMQATVARRVLDSFIELAPEYTWQEVRRSPTGDALVIREPVGVVLAVVPWNVPQVITMMKIAPALLAGCSVVLKPAPETPLDAYLLADLAAQAGLPDGVLNVVPARAEVSEYLVTHPGVDKVSFTGSTAVGKRIAALCGQDVRRVTLELGGKSAAIIFEDADLETAVKTLRLGSLRNNGQVCSAKSRILVSRSIEHEVIEGLHAMMSAMPIGDPSDVDTMVGPLVTARQRERVEGYFEIGKREGAEVVLGGGRPSDQPHGWFIEPTIFRDVRRDMTIAQDEIFGPVLTVLTFDDDDEAVAIANDSRYGLSGAVYTQDLERGMSVARGLRTGAIELNGSPTGSRAPLGGFKQSGLGREGGPEGFDAYVEVKSVGLPAGMASAGAVATN